MERSFCGFEIAAHPVIKGALVIKGANFDVFNKNFTFDLNSRVSKSVITDIDPANIEGIIINQWEIEHPDEFWSMHKQGGTIDSFVTSSPTYRNRSFL